MSRKSLVDKSTEQPSVKKTSIEMPTSENLTESLGSIREDCLGKPIGLIDRLILKEIGLCAEKLGLDHEELQAWITLQAEVPPKSLLHALRTTRQYGLDPLQEEVLVTKYDEGWQVSISVNGWMKLINQHPAFAGLTFSQSTEEKEGMPIWMECTIHRSDRAIPTTVREYMTEARNESEAWQKMPRRMLRHRVLQQCARVAIGIRAPELHSGNKEKQKLKNSIDYAIRSYEIGQNIHNKAQQYGVAGLKIKLATRALS
jgi:ribosomal protein L21E